MEKSGLGFWAAITTIAGSNSTTKAHGLREKSEVGYAYSELENSFDLPIEKLMLEVLALILSAGRSSDKVKRYHLDIIHGLLKGDQAVFCSG